MVLKILLENHFKKLKRTFTKKPFDIKSGITVIQILMKGDVCYSRIIVLRKIFLID